MTDRLTQLQICLDQLTDMFFASLTYVDQNHDSVKLDESDPKLVDPDYHPPSDTDFQSNLQELSRDIILKTRQILTIIDTLPGVGVSKVEQLQKIQSLSSDLEEVELEKKKAIVKKDDLMKVVDRLILIVSNGIADTRD
ncbi:DEKNAAC104496 [Brettanomyces naardenensis]|uniref:Mediator of RNA polymerase II transcription subunit 21 n=1 Tax=Brettanomyces naardenensis TaxID=13370 RepID=A0A448YR53_BRENA|nr:DEKNAAC104496 [Brettanomyces naardenensis]